MATNASQIVLIVQKLKQDGKVCRNWCLERYISRLSAIIYTLSHEYDWEFLRQRVYLDKSKKHWDYCYIVVKHGKDPRTN